MISKLDINEQSIKTALSTYKDNPYKSLAEYIWNSFDAGATEVNVDFELPDSEIGYVQAITITDNGKGWNFNSTDTKMFLASSKTEEKQKNKTLPRGKMGRGRYVFIWFCDRLEAESLGKKLVLMQNTEISGEEMASEVQQGTKVTLFTLQEKMSIALKDVDALLHFLTLEFCWFLRQNTNRRILVNDHPINYEKNVKAIHTMTKTDFDESVIKFLGDNDIVEIVLWEEKPDEYAKFYFLNPETNTEIFTKTTSLNKKNDDYWHSVYVRSKLFKENDVDVDEDPNQQTFDFINGEQKEAKKNILALIRKKLIEIRKPLLIQSSNSVIAEIRSKKAMPVLPEYGIYDDDGFQDLLKQIYIIAPSLFNNKSQEQIKFLCATIAALLSSQDSTLLTKVLEQVQELSEDERSDLQEILQRTSLSNVVKTIKEIDYRLRVLDDLEKLLFIHEAETLEVDHLQKVLNQNVWIFGEEYRLFRDTEGALHKTLHDYAQSILGINTPTIQGKSRRELDLFLVKSLKDSESVYRNIVVEIKRPNVILGKKEYLQIEEYALEIKKESICNGDNMYWDFYLIGNDFDDYIAAKIEEARNHGERSKGLTSNRNDGRHKIYVRKWSDIIHVELGHKMKYLKEKIQFEQSSQKHASPKEIVAKYQK